MPDLYELLGLSRDATPDQIKRAYRQKARELHPDAGGDAEAFKELTHAYQVLSDPERRARYDRFGDDGTPATRGSGDPFGFGDGGFGAGFGGIDDVIEAFFGSAFGGSGSRPTGRRGRTRAQPGRDVLVPVELSLEEVAAGVRREVEVEVAALCEVCGGAGSADGGPPGHCGTCSGAGQVQRVVRTAFGQLATATACPTCNGTGRVVTNPCTSCGGEGRTVRKRVFAVDIPAGVQDGDRKRVSGAGEAGRQGGQAGDLYVEIRVAEHEVFERDGRDLVAEVTIPISQAALGGTLTVPGIDGSDIEATVPAGTQPGDVIVVRRAGLPGQGGGRRGDLRLIARVEVPRDLDAEQRTLLERFATLRGDHLASRGRGLFTRLRGAFQR